MQASRTKPIQRAHILCVFAFWWVLICLCVPAIAGDGHYIIDNWNIDSKPPLPENAIIALTQTRDGYLWLGTYNGLARFDGVEFALFDESNAPGLESGPIIYVFEDSQTNLWLGTSSGEIVIVKNGRLFPLPIGAHTHEGRLSAACEDSEGAVWLYTEDGQLFRYYDGKVQVCRIETLGNRSHCRTLIAEKSGLVWVGTDTQMFGFNPKPVNGTNSPLEQILTVTTASAEVAFGGTAQSEQGLSLLVAGRDGGYWRLANGEVQKWSHGSMEKNLGSYRWKQMGQHILATTACEDHAGNLVIGTSSDGVWVYDATGTQPPAHISTAQGLSSPAVLSVCVDREDTLWVGTDGGGLDRIKRQIFGVVSGTISNTVQTVCLDDKGGVLFGKFGGGLARWTGQNVRQFGPQQAFQKGEFLIPAATLAIRSVLMDHNHQIWAGSDEIGLLHAADEQFSFVPEAVHLNQHISAIFEDRKKNLWLGTEAGLVLWQGTNSTIYNTNLSLGMVRAIADDSAGNLWIGTDAGLNCLRDGKFTAYHKDNGLPSEHVTALFVDHDDVVWIGTSSGMARLHDGKWARYTTREGLSANSIDYLTEDNQEFLWIGSNAGLMRVAKKSLNDLAFGLTNFVNVRDYDKADGLPTRECSQGSQPATGRSLDGTLWFATIRGLVFVNPVDLKPNTNPPPVAIELVLMDNEKQNTNYFRGQLTREIIVPPGAKELDIQYAGLNLTAPEKTRFKYRLAEDTNTAWTDAGNRRIASYPKLSPGEYFFEVTACNEDGAWNETGARLAITVLPPFWRKPWFLGLMAACLLAMVAGVVHYFSTQRLQRQLEGMRQQQALEKERSRIARDIHDQLGASLTQVSMLGEMVESDKNEPAEVEAHARQISQTARDTSRALDEIVWTVNPSNDTVEGLVNYICKYAQEYFAVANVRYRFDVPSQLPDTDISPEVRHNVFLATKEAVTNVVRHAKATEVWLRLHFTTDSFTIELQDNGRGPGDLTGKESRNGLRNMHKRMEDVGGSFALTAAPGGGALVRLTVPIIGKN